MTTKMIIVVTVVSLCFGALKVHAADLGQGIGQMKKQFGQLMQEQPDLMKKLMDNPQSVVANAYRKSLMAYAAALQDVAEKGEIPPGVSKELVARMKKDSEEMKKHFDEAWASTPELNQKLGDLRKTAESVYGVLQDHVNNLEKAVQAEKEDLQTILGETKALLPQCEGMGILERLKEGGKSLLK